MRDHHWFNARGSDCLPGLLGIVFDEVTQARVRGHLAVRPALMAPNGFLHAAGIVALADTACGYGCVAALPEGATGFTTVELKSNHLGTAREGTIDCVATPALFRCTQMLLYAAR
jgi:uncharacterized protein (TIGR00369 family)